jgi:hypothetical protein
VTLRTFTADVTARADTENPVSAVAKLIATIDFAMMALIHFSKVEWVECPRQQLTNAALENGFRVAVIRLQNLERTDAK